MNRRFASRDTRQRRRPALLGAAALFLVFLLGLAATQVGCPFGACGECFRDMRCVEKCGGAVIQDGCCACPSGTFDDIECTDAGEDCGECFRAIECVASCGGAVVQSGCCPCPTGTFDNLSCQDAGGDAGDGG